MTHHETPHEFPHDERPHPRPAIPASALSDPPPESRGWKNIDRPMRPTSRLIHGPAPRFKMPGQRIEVFVRPGRY